MHVCIWAMSCSRNENIRPMHIILVSEDQELRKLCSEVLDEFSGLDWQLTAATPSDCPAGADFYIWDDHGRVVPLPHLDPNWSKHLFVIHRDDIARYRANPDETF